MPPLADIPTTALVYCYMLAAIRPALALPRLLTLSIDQIKPDSHLTTIYTAYGAASYLLTPYKYLLLAAAIARWMDIDWPTVLNRFLLRPICLLGEDSCSVCLASPREDELHKRRPAVPIPPGLAAEAIPERKLCWHNCLSWRASYSETNRGIPEFSAGYSLKRAYA
jgi:hypothetical protein